MKKLTMIALALAAVILLTGTAMALDVSWTGQYRVRGYYMMNENLDDGDTNCDTDNKFYDQRFRLETTFQVHDRLAVVTRFDALDNGQWGTHNIYSAGNDDFNFDRAYMQIKFPYFNMEIGRQGGGVWGTKFIDYSYSIERIKAVTKVDNWTLVGIIQKHVEQDGSASSANAPAFPAVCADCGAGTQLNDSDRDIYYLGAIYKGEGWDAGLLTGYSPDKTKSDLAVGAYDFTEWFLMPYWRFPLWVLQIEGEACYTGGEWDYRASGVDDEDQKAWAFNLNAGFDLGPVGMNLGYAHTSGDDDLTDNDRENFYRAGGQDWQPLLIMTGYYMDANLGCYGNLNMRNAGGNLGGYDLFYIQADWSPIENWTFDAAFGYAQLAETDAIEQFNGITDLDDEVGYEFDLGVTWNIMPNLVYNAKGGYFKDGDFYQFGSCDRDTDYELSFIHALVVTF
jgi:hypothetical protein